MALMNYIQARSYEAGADLTESQFRFVKWDGDSVVRAEAGEAAAGVLLNDPNEDGAARVGYFGVLKVEAGDTVTAGAEVTSDADGKAVAATTGDIVLGIAREDAVVDQIMSIDFFLGGNEVPA